MNKNLFLLMIFVPLHLVGQQLDCCKTIKEVESYLNGKWKKSADDKKEYHYIFNEGQGIFLALKVNEKRALETINNMPVGLKILKSEKGFKIELKFGSLSIYSEIKHLDSIKLITVRRDGKEAVLYRIIE